MESLLNDATQLGGKFLIGLGLEVVVIGYLVWRKKRKKNRRD